MRHPSSSCANDPLAPAFLNTPSPGFTLHPRRIARPTSLAPASCFHLPASCFLCLSCGPPPPPPPPATADKISRIHFAARHVDTLRPVRVLVDCPGILASPPARLDPPRPFLARPAPCRPAPFESVPTTDVRPSQAVPCAKWLLDAALHPPDDPMAAECTRGTNTSRPHFSRTVSF